MNRNKMRIILHTDRRKFIISKYVNKFTA